MTAAIVQPNWARVAMRVLGAAVLTFFAGFGLPAQAQTWISMSSEGGDFTFLGTQTVRFGAGTQWLQRSASGTVVCSLAFFGSDPAPYVPKTCELLIPGMATPPAGMIWTKMADQWQTVNFNGTQTIRFGTGSSWVQASLSGSVECHESFFGVDPAYGSSKQCDILMPQPPPGTWTKVADQWQAFTVAGTRLVRFGTDWRWLQTNITGTVQCDESVFGSDPAVGEAKRCEVFTGSTAALPAPPVSPMPVINYEYDAQGNPTKRVQAPGVSGFAFATTATYDTLDRRKDTTDATGGKTQFASDGLDRTTQVTDPRNLVTQSPRNGFGDVTQLVSPDSGAEVAPRTYDAVGNLKTRTDSRGVLATYSYDELNRLTRVVYTQTGKPTQTYSSTYDDSNTYYPNAIGRLSFITFPEGNRQQGYDAWGRPANVDQRLLAVSGVNAALSLASGYTYDAAGHVTALRYSSGRVVTFTYANGRPVAVGLKASANATVVPLLSSIQFSPFAGPQSWNWEMTSGAQPVSRVFDTSGRLVRYPLGGLIRDLTYDAADRITQYTHYDSTSAAAQPAYDQSFGYDELGRLKTVITTAGQNWTIGYDANGNRTGVTLGATTSTYTTPATSNRLVSLTNPPRSLTYDAAGNITQDTNSAAPYTATYDLAGRMDTLTRAGVKTTYTYDNEGRRVRKSSTSGAAATVAFVYDLDGHLMGEYDQNGVALREYAWLGDIPVAVFTPDPANAANPPLIYFIHTDHLNTPRVVVDRAGNQRWNWLAEPFGTTASNTNPQSLGTFAFNLRFPGQYADAESGLFYNYFRNYDSSVGRYTQSDPIGLDGGINAYVYVRSSPLSYFDPNGLADIPSPDKVPGGPWTPNDANRPGNFSGPKPPNGGGRAQCQFVPDEANGGPPGSKGYWKTNQPGQKGWQRYDLDGNPIEIEKAHRNIPIPRIPGLAPLMCPLCGMILEPMPSPNGPS